MNTVISLTPVIVVFLFAETNESIAVRKNTISPHGRMIGTPKPANTIGDALIITYEVIVPLVLVKVCELVDSAFYHIKKLARSQFLTLGDFGNLHQSLLAKVGKTAVIVTLLRWVRHRRDSERKV